MYGHAKWTVFRLRGVPEDALNETPYDSRGWCFFETCVAALAAYEVATIGSEDFEDDPEPVPRTPVQFDETVRKLHFTSPNADKDTVVQLYSRIFPRLAEHEEMKVQFWKDSNVCELLDVLPKFTGLKTVQLTEQSS